jgi:dihydroneopterin aldolase
MTDITIQLEKLRIFAHHGIHPQERVAGAEFEVDVQVRYAAQGMISALDQTIDYTTVLEIVRQQMNDPRPLLETVAMDMAETIRQQFAQAKEINITIRKIHPPIRNFRGRLSVTLHKTYP